MESSKIKELAQDQQDYVVAMRQNFTVHRSFQEKNSTQENG